MSLIVELKRRNVFKVAMAYLALGWVIVQVTATLVPYMRLPEWTVPMVVTIGLVGFPCVLLFSWIYELTPEGLKRESEIDRDRSITHTTGKRLDYTIIGLLVAAIAMFALDRFAPASSVGAGSSVGGGLAPDKTLDAGTSAAEASRGQGPLPQVSPTTTPAPDEKSIAVLPFVNMSSDAEQEYFSDGLTEELLNLLARIPELRVTSRSSAFAFKGKDIELTEVARRLDVAHILEGSVRKSGERVRITAQLIDTRSDTHLWSQSWDRTLQDIFAVQDEIAAAVSAQMKISLLGATPKTREAVPAAYALYLKARLAQQLGSPEGYEQAVGLYQQALALDPDYAAALAGLSRAYSAQAGGGLRPMNEGFRMAREAANRALALDPSLAAAHAQLSRIAFAYDSDFAAAARHIETALQLEPANPDILGAAANLARTLGRPELAVSLVEYARDRDPLNSSLHNNLGLYYVSAKRFDDALAEFRSALQLSPGRIGTRYNIGEALLHKGETTAALGKIGEEPQEVWRLIGLAMGKYSAGDDAGSLDALRKLEGIGAESWSYNIAFVYAWRNEPDKAFEWLEKAIVYHDSGLSEIVNERLFDNVRKDPRWLPFLRRIGMAPEQLAAIEFRPPMPGEAAGTTAAEPAR